MHKEELIRLYSDVTTEATRSIRPPHESVDAVGYNYLHGRLKGYVRIFELVQEDAESILQKAETDFNGMLAEMEELIGRLVMTAGQVERSLNPDYYRGKSETAKIGKIIFRMFAKQKLIPQKPS